jgi:hypothetical protein
VNCFLTAAFDAFIRTGNGMVWQRFLIGLESENSPQ